MAWALWESNVWEITEVNIAVPVITSTEVSVLSEVVGVDLSELCFHVTCGEGTGGKSEEKDSNLGFHCFVSFNLF